MEKQPTIITAKMLRIQTGITVRCFICSFFEVREVLEEEVVPFFLVVETVLFFCTADIGLLRCGIYFKRSMFLEIGTDYAN